MSRCLLLWLFVCTATVCVTADRHHSPHRDRREHNSEHDGHGERSVNYDSDDDSDSPDWKHSHDTWKPKEKAHRHNHPADHQKRWDDDDRRDGRHEAQNGRHQHDRHRRNHDEQDRQSENSLDRSKQPNRDHADNNERKRDHHHHQEHQHGHRHGGRYADHKHHERYHRDKRSNEEHELGRVVDTVVTETAKTPDNAVYITDAESVEVVSAESAQQPTSTPSASEHAEAAASPPTYQIETAPPAWSGQPPPHQDAAAMARYIVHISDWVAMATISTRPNTRGMPFANVFSVADGTRYRSTGVPYMYLTDWEMSVKDLRVNNNASLTMSLAQSDYCAEHQYDPESPLCAHVILSGSVRQMDETEADYKFAHDALFTRHPEMANWPSGHQWFVALLEIQDIIVLDYFGGAITVPKKDYFAASPFTVGEGRESNLV